MLLHSVFRFIFPTVKCFEMARWSISHWYNVLPLSVLGWAHRGPGYFRAQLMLLLEQKLRRRSRAVCRSVGRSTCLPDPPRSFWQHERGHSIFKKVRVVMITTPWCCSIWNTQSRARACVCVCECVRVCFGREQFFSWPRNCHPVMEHEGTLLYSQ